MAHEELKKQYEEDCKNNERPWELWEYKSPGWHTHRYPPKWASGCEYRRKEPPFTPEYFSGLNWREAEKLDGMIVEASCDAEDWERIRLEGFSRITNNRFRSVNGHVYTYIRTCHQPHAHPKIDIGGVELPRPEVEAPEYGTVIYIFAPELPKKFFTISWFADEMNDCRLRDGVVHLTEGRVKAWGSWWQNTVVAAVNK